MTTVRVHLVGTVAVEVDGRAVTLPPGRPTEVLAWLAARPGAHPRRKVAPTFWPDISDATSLASLRTALWALRRSLGPVGESVLAIDRHSVALDGDQLWVDLRELAALQPDQAVAVVEMPLRGELLPGVEGEWADEVRDEHHRRTLDLLDEVAARAAAAGDLELAVRASRRRAVADPHSEEAHRALLGNLAAFGDRASALQEHEAFRRRLWDDLQVRPSSATEQVVRSLRVEAVHSTGPQPASVPVAAPPAVGPGARGRLPTRLARAEREGLVGRDGELHALRTAWTALDQDGGPHLVLVGGEAGIGKTRLAARFAAERLAAGTSVWFGSAAEDALIPAEPFLEAFDQPRWPVSTSCSTS